MSVARVPDVSADGVAEANARRAEIIGLPMRLGTTAATVRLLAGTTANHPPAMLAAHDADWSLAPAEDDPLRDLDPTCTWWGG